MLALSFSLSLTLLSLFSTSPLAIAGRSTTTDVPVITEAPTLVNRAVPQVRRGYTRVKIPPWPRYVEIITTILQVPGRPKPHLKPQKPRVVPARRPGTGGSHLDVRIPDWPLIVEVFTKTAKHRRQVTNSPTTVDAASLHTPSPTLAPRDPTAQPAPEVPQQLPEPLSHFTRVAIPNFPTEVIIRTVTPTPGLRAAPSAGKVPHPVVPVQAPDPTASFTKVAIPDAPAIVEIITTVVPLVKGPEGPPGPGREASIASPAPLPKPRNYRASDCPRRPGNQDWDVTGEQPQSRYLNLPANNKTILVDDVRVALSNGPAGLRKRSRLPQRERRRPPSLECHLIASTHYQHDGPTGADKAVSSPIVLPARIRYAFAVSSNHTIDHLGILLDRPNTREDEYIWTWAQAPSASSGRQAVVELAFKTEQRVKLVVDFGASSAAGEMGLFHLGP